jgi:hypothetical protein
VRGGSDGSRHPPLAGSLMSALPLAVVLSMAASCQSVVAPATIAGIAQHESGLDPDAVHRNADGSTDFGLMQINSTNFSWLGLTAQSALDPCRSIAAAARLLTSFSRYNTGSPTQGIRNGYALAVADAAYAAHAHASGASRGSSAKPADGQDAGDIDDVPSSPTGETTFGGE